MPLNRSDPMLRQWVPEWVVEQYERANPFFREVLTALQVEWAGGKKALLRRTRREMVERHQRFVKRALWKEQTGAVSSGEEGGDDGGAEDDEDIQVGGAR